MIYLKLVQLSLFKVISGITKLYFICFSFVSIQRHENISICSSSSHVAGPHPNIPNSFYKKNSSFNLVKQGLIKTYILLALGADGVTIFGAGARTSL